jgi:hypothetical protein
MIRVLVFVLGFYCLSFSKLTYAAGGRLRTFESDHSTPNWHVDHPKVVFAFGYLEKSLADRYSKFAHDYFQKKLTTINPSLGVEVLEEARGDSVVTALRDPDTVGLIFISHTFKTRFSKASIALTADGYPLPMDILSAATPSLRFAGFFGCHGPGLLKQYEVEYEFDRLPGHHVFYYDDDHLLSANFLGFDDLKKLLKKTAKQLESIGTLGGSAGLVRGVTPPSGDDGILRVRVKNVVAFAEPRYVYVNDHIVGMLGSNDKNSNQNLESIELEYKVPRLALQTRKSCHTIKVLSSQLTLGAPANDYVLETVSINLPETTRSKTYDPALQLGENSPTHKRFYIDCI